jgi:hypothetical protein
LKSFSEKVVFESAVFNKTPVAKISVKRVQNAPHNEIKN